MNVRTPAFWGRAVLRWSFTARGGMLQVLREWLGIFQNYIQSIIRVEVRETPHQQRKSLKGSQYAFAPIRRRWCGAGPQIDASLLDRLMTRSKGCGYKMTKALLPPSIEQSINPERTSHRKDKTSLVSFYLACYSLSRFASAQTPRGYALQGRQHVPPRPPPGEVSTTQGALRPLAPPQSIYSHGEAK